MYLDTSDNPTYSNFPVGLLQDSNKYKKEVANNIIFVILLKYDVSIIISNFVFEKKHQNSGTLGKDTINNWIIPFLSVGKRFSFNKGEQPDVYFDEELYKNRFKIEQANGWLDGYKGLIMRYKCLDITWIGMLLLGFISKFLKKV